MSVVKNEDENSSPAQVAGQTTEQRADENKRPTLVQYLKSFPADVDLDDEVFARNPMPSRNID